MNLLHVISTMNPRAGGPCQGVRNLADRVRELGNEVEVVCLDLPDSDYVTREKLEIHALGNGLGPWCYNSGLRPWLTSNLPRFDAVILNGLWQYPGYALSRLARLPTTPPYFVFPHGMLDPWFQRARERRLKAARNWLYWKLIEHSVIQRAEAVFFTCAEEMRLAQGTFRPYQPKRQINVGYGVSQPPANSKGMMDAFLQRCPGVKGCPYFLFLGRIHPKKGVDLLIKAYAKVYGANSGAHQPPSLVIAGPGLESEYGKRMVHLAASTCPPCSVFFPGMLSGEAKWGALYNTEAFVLTSHQENFGIAVGEALACGIPVLISNQVNIWQEIEEDKAGFADDDTLAGAVRLLQRWKSLIPGDRARMKHIALTCFENRFGIVPAAGNLLDAIENAPRRLRCLNLS
jgi:glycosyltransferase involved in cell wall biosynthesis